MGRQGSVGGPPPQGPVPVLAGLMDGNGCSIGTHILSYKPTFALSVSGVLGLSLVEGIVVVRGEVEPIFVLMSLSGGAQSAPGFCRHVYPDGSFAPYFQ